MFSSSPVKVIIVDLNEKNFGNCVCVCVCVCDGGGGGRGGIRFYVVS